ncbi:hypothetical protein FACS189413_01440 [Bacteroidia bacterium]|nr:hypothetical protein FACS189413_01440 [Bacteroidia bacterium]
MMNKKIIEKNIDLTFDFVNHLIDNKSDLGKLPDKFILISHESYRIKQQQ